MSMSKLRWRKLEYTAKTGIIPCLAMPAAMLTAWPSAMPTSKNRLGQAAANSCRPVPGPMAAVMAQIRLSSPASSTSSWPKI